MARQDVARELVRHEAQGRIDLARDAFGRGGHVGVDQCRQEIDEVGRDVDDGVAFGAVLGKEGVADVGVLEVLVASCGNGHRQRQTQTKLDVLQGVNVLRQQAVDVLDQRRLGFTGHVGGGDHAVVFGHDELDGPVHKVAEVVQELAVVLGDEFVPCKHRVAGFGA